MIPHTHEALQTLIQSVELYSATLKEWLAMDDNSPAIRKFPAELRQLYEHRIDFCDDLLRQLYDRRVDMRLDELFEGGDRKPAKGAKKKPAKAAG